MQMRIVQAPPLWSKWILPRGEAHWGFEKKIPEMVTGKKKCAQSVAAVAKGPQCI